MESMLFFFVFITVFQAIGMAMLGSTLRGIMLEVRQHGWKGIGNVNSWLSRLIVGVGFAIISTLAGYSQLTSLFRILHIILGLAVFIFSLIGLRGRLFTELPAKHLSIIVFGTLFFVIGMGTAGEMLRQREILAALVFGVFFSGLGAATMVIGLKGLIDEK